MKFSWHAKKRWEERFPQINILEELKTAVLFGGQYGKSEAFLCNCGAVVIIEGKEIITVLTKDQYIANQLARNGSINYKYFISPTPIAEAEAEQKTSREKEEEELENELRPIAMRHIESGKTGYEYMRERNTELKNLGYTISKRRFYTLLLAKICRESIVGK